MTAIPQTDRTAPLVEATAVTRHYRVSTGAFGHKATLHALSGVDLSIPRGAVVGLVGESGSGKSTLSRLLLGLETPTAGRVTLEGRPIAEIPRKQVARRIQPVFQDPYSSLNPSWRVADLIGLPLAVHGIGDGPSRARRVRELLDLVGLPGRVADAYPAALSGGQRQRVAIARALAIEPEVLICDEPTSALDVSVQAQILNLLLDLRRETGVAMLFISHDLAVVEHMTDRVAVLYLGRVVEQGPTAEVFNAPKHPYTAALKASVLTPDDAAGLPDLALGTVFPNPLDPPAGCRFHPRCPRATDRCRTEAPATRDVAGRRVECHWAE